MSTARPRDPLLVDLPAAIDTPRLHLRPPQPGDGPAFLDALVETLPALRRFLGALSWVAGEPDADAAERFCRQAHANFAARTDLPFFVFERGSGQLLGAVGLHRTVWATPKTEVGYWCRTRRTGEGFVTEAVEAASRYAFEAIGAVRIELVTDRENLASRRVAERCGYALEGVLRHERRGTDGSLRDTCIYARLRDAAIPPEE